MTQVLLRSDLGSGWDGFGYGSVDIHSSAARNSDLPSHDLAVPTRQQNVDANRVIGSDTTSQHIAPVSSSSTRRLARFDCNEAVKHYFESGPNRSP